MGEGNGPCVGGYCENRKEVLISPTEPKKLRDIGTTSSTPEDYGADIIFHVPEFGVVGIQRKEFGDLVNSVYEGRVGTQIAKMKKLDLGMWVIEGRPQWMNDGKLLGRGNFSLASLRGVLWRIQLENYWVTFTSSMDETIDCLLQFERWVKENVTGNSVSSLLKKEKVTTEWGTQGSKEWSVQVYCNFGLGVTLAGRVYDELGLPLEWKVGEEEFMKVKGIGKSRAEKIVRSLNGKSG